MGQQTALETRCIALLGELGLAEPKEVGDITPLTGGVASDIVKAETKNGDFCIKFALAKLKVEEEWLAPVHRNAAEYAWLKTASDMSPGYFPKLFGRSVAENGFAMEFVSGEGVYLWKQALLEGGPTEGEAASVARLLGQVHLGSARPGFDRSPFHNAEDFEALRLEAYLRFTASRHPLVAASMIKMADQLFAATKVLVHGDVSPKNILFRGDAPVLLDAECATMGDASFDVSFCLNHLVLKAFHNPAQAAAFMDAACEFVDIYFACVDWEDPARLNGRVARLLPMLMLARIDGKSPVEYLDEATRTRVRQVSLSNISAPASSLTTLFSNIKDAMKS